MKTVYQFPIPCKTLNNYSISSIQFKWYALYKVITDEKQGWYWYMLGTRRYI